MYQYLLKVKVNCSLPYTVTNVTLRLLMYGRLYFLKRLPYVWSLKNCKIRAYGTAILDLSFFYLKLLNKLSICYQVTVDYTD